MDSRNKSGPGDNPESEYKDDLFKEGSLWEIYQASRRIPAPKVNLLIPAAATVLLAAFEGFVLAGYLSVSVSDQMSQIRNWVELGISFGTSILGFLIAGFTILAGLNRAEMFQEMARIQDPTTKLSFLKKNLFVFMQVFFEYLVLVGVCFAVKMVAWPGGPVSALSGWVEQRWNIDLRPWLVSGGVIVGGAWMMHAMMVLKSFVYNVYNVVITGIAWDEMIKETTAPTSGVSTAVADTPTVPRSLPEEEQQQIVQGGGARAQQTVNLLGG